MKDMKFKISKNELTKILDMANNIINENAINVVLSNLLLEVDMDSNILTCSFTNESISVKCEIKENIEIEKSGKALIKVKILKGIISKLQNSDILVEKIDNSLRIKSDSFDAFINCLNDEIFVNLQFDYNDGIEFEMNNSLINEIQKKLNHCLLSKLEKQNILNGVYFDNANESGKINLVATDSYKVSLLKKPFNAPPFKIVVEQEFLSFIGQYARSDEIIKFSIVENSTKLIARWKNVICSSKLLIGNYPNIYNVFSVSEEETSEFLVNAKNFFNIIDHGMYLVSSEKRPVTNISVKNNVLQVEFKSLDIGVSSEKINISDFRGRDIEFLVNSKFIIAIMKAFEEHNIRVYFSAPNKPIIFADVVDKDFLQLVLPLRTY